MTSPLSNPTIVFLSGDLIFSAKVRSACQDSGVAFWCGTSLPTLEQESVRMVILDLATRSGLTESLPQDARKHFPSATLIAYGPHVQKERLDKARQSGFDRVMTRGQFDQGLSALLSDVG